MGNVLIHSISGSAVVASLLVAGCSGTGSGKFSGQGAAYNGGGVAGGPRQHYPLGRQGSQAVRVTPNRTYQNVSVTAPTPVPLKLPTSLLTEVRVHKDYLPRSARGRRGQSSMRPRYITIHSTQNWSRGADSWRHSLALKGSKLGSLSWHYTVDENVAVQHLPTNITGRHADFNGPGNKYSIGIEMCEHRGNSRTRTVDRTAKLAAYLMYKYDLPLSKVVPHYHWPRHGMSPAHKNCPHFLLDNGRPGRKWRGFQAKVKKYHDRITIQGPTYASR